MTDCEKSRFVEEVWKECNDNINKLCHFKLSSYPDLADDISSEVFLIFQKAINSDTIIHSPKAWLYSVANNLIIKAYRNINKQQERICSLNYIDGISIQLSMYPDFTDREFSDDDLDEILNNIKDELKNEERIILESFHNENRSLKEIASMLGKSENAVKQKHYRVCIKVRKLVKDHIENTL